MMWRSIYKSRNYTGKENNIEAVVGRLLVLYRLEVGGKVSQSLP